MHFNEQRYRNQTRKTIASTLLIIMERDIRCHKISQLESAIAEKYKMKGLRKRVVGLYWADSGGWDVLGSNNYYKRTATAASSSI